MTAMLSTSHWSMVFQSTVRANHCTGRTMKRS